jgi:hypothetical protein
MGEKFVECHLHGKLKPAFLCHHLLSGEIVGWNEPDEYTKDEDDDFYGCINAWCDECEKFAIETVDWTEESEAFANIQLVCEGCALSFKELNLE